MKAVVVKPEGVELVEIEKGLEPMQDAVGGYLESVGSGDDWVAYADEEGRLRGLPINERAPEILSSLGVYQPTLVGTVVIVGLSKPDKEGEQSETDAPKVVLEAAGL